jgi:hypothetical protein
MLSGHCIKEIKVTILGLSGQTTVQNVEMFNVSYLVTKTKQG